MVSGARDPQGQVLRFYGPSRAGPWGPGPSGRPTLTPLGPKAPPAPLPLPLLLLVVLVLVLLLVVLLLVLVLEVIVS